jgi:hypothetical protein
MPRRNHKFAPQTIEETARLTREAIEIIDARREQPTETQERDSVIEGTKGLPEQEAFEQNSEQEQEQEQTAAELPAPERTKDAKGRYTDATERENTVELFEKFKSKSAVIRHLHSQGYAPSSIAKLLNVVYQHVRNVIHQKAKKA